MADPQPKKFEYPGVTLPLRYWGKGHSGQKPYFRTGAHDECYEAMTAPLQMREVAMMLLMDRLTDKPDWHKKIEDPVIVDKWRQEALTQPEDELHDIIILDKHSDAIPRLNHTRLIDEDCFDYCIQELKSKAAFFKETGIVITLDAKGTESYRQRGFQIAKSDVLVSTEIRNGLRAAFDKLRAEQASSDSGLDWHPWADDKVLDLVHPSMYPFIFGQSRFIPDEVVGVADAVEKWAGKGEIVENGPPLRKVSPGRGWRPFGPVVDGAPSQFWSDTYQWLPSNLSFKEDGTVRFTSYINNLHPTRHPEIYRLVEKLIDAAIPLWDVALAEEYAAKLAGTHAEREPRFPGPTGSHEEDEDKLWHPYDPVELEKWEKLHGQEKHLFRPESEHGSDVEMLDSQTNDGEGPEHHGIEQSQAEESQGDGSQEDDDGSEISLVSREAGSSEGQGEGNDGPEDDNNQDDEDPEGSEGLHAYEIDWVDAMGHGVIKFKRGGINNPENRWMKIRDPILLKPNKFDGPCEYRTGYTIRELCKDRGLQVIVKMASIELTPEKPEFPVGSWHVEGMMNERIVGTALYYLDSENVTPTHLSFRMQTTEMDSVMTKCDQDYYGYFQRLFGTDLSHGGHRIQNFGNVETREGRLLAFPNVFQHRVSGFSLQDRTKPGHRRFIAIWLVDPRQRIISTANVPPQRMDWWAEAAFGSGTGSNNPKGEMPPEILQLLQEKVCTHSKAFEGQPH